MRGARRVAATASTATAPPASTPIPIPRRTPPGVRPNAEAFKPSARAARSETATSAAPAITNCGLPPGSTAVSPIRRWRRLPQTTRTTAKSRIFIGALRAGDRVSRLAGAQKRRLDVVAGEVDLPVADFPVERLGGMTLDERGVVGE